jgi:7-cyano-7-deazaguanine synthase
MLVTLAAMAYAEDGLTEIGLGTVITDKAHPDGRPRFLQAIDRVISVQSGVRVLAPGAKLTTLQLVETTQVPLSILGWTFSCHTGVWACGTCRGCIKHDEVMTQVARAIQDAGELLPAAIAG